MTKTDNLIVTDGTFDAEVCESPIPVLVDFWGSWCIPSQMMMPVLEKLHKHYEGKVKIRKINVDQNPKKRAEHRILGCPSLVLFKQGKELERRVGAQSFNQVQAMIDAHLD